MTDLIYVGRHGAVDVPCPNGTEPTVKWGDVFTTTAEHAASLLEQPDNWQPAPKAGKPKAAKPAGEE